MSLKVSFKTFVSDNTSCKKSLALLLIKQEIFLVLFFKFILQFLLRCLTKKKITKKKKKIFQRQKDPLKLSPPTLDKRFLKM